MLALVDLVGRKHVSNKGILVPCFANAALVDFKILIGSSVVLL